MKKVSAVFLIMTAVLVLSGAVKAEVYTTLTPHLVDLRGWEAEKAEGMDVNMPGMGMISATRMYTQGDKELAAMIMIGNEMMIAGHAGIEMNTAEFSMSTKKINGFDVISRYDKIDKAGAITVFLEKGQTAGSFFVLSFSNIDENEALELAKQFDWTKMKKAVEAGK